MFFPSRKDDRVFRLASKLLPVFVWAIGLAIFCPTWIKSNGQFGLECKSMTCRWISKDENKTPTEYDPEVSGQILVMIIGTLILLLNVTTFIKLRVRYFCFLKTATLFGIIYATIFCFTIYSTFFITTLEAI